VLLEHEEAAQNIDDLVVTKMKALNVKQETRKKNHNKRKHRCQNRC